MSIAILRAAKEDMPYIEEKMHKYLLDSTNVSWQQFFVVKNDGKTVAFGRILDHGEFLEPASLGVDYYYRKKGIGAKLLKFLIKEAKRLDPAKPIYGVTHRPSFLEQCGFKEIYSYPDKLEYKRNHICKLDRSKIKIMKYDT